MQKEQEQTTDVFVKPVYDRIFIERDPEIKKTESGVIVPQTAREKPNMGTVRLVGEECKKAKPGDRIFFGRGAGLDIAIGSMIFTMLRESDIFAFTNHPPIQTGEEYKTFRLHQDIVNKNGSN